MNGRRLLALFAAALAVIAFAFWLSTQRYLPRDPAFGVRVLPGLAPVLNDVTSIRLIGAGDRTLVTLDRPQGRWRVAERDYPADASRVRRLLIGLGELVVREPKTADKARYAVLGVEDTAAADATGLRVELAGTRTPFALIVGRSASPGGTYVRVPAVAQSLLAEPVIEIERDPRQWLARTVVDVEPARVQSAEIAPAGSAAWRAVKDARTQANFAVPDLPRGTTLSSVSAADAQGGALGNLEAEDVARVAQIDAGAPAPSAQSRAVYRTFDGLVLTFTGRVVGDDHWLGVDAAFDPALAARFPPAAGDRAPGAEQVRADAQRIADTARGWLYRVPRYRYETIFRPRDELVRH